MRRETKHEKAKKSAEEIFMKEALLFFVVVFFQSSFYAQRKVEIASFLRKLLKLSEWRCEKLADGCW
jgi:hypothetical protein